MLNLTVLLLLQLWFCGLLVCTRVFIVLLNNNVSLLSPDERLAPQLAILHVAEAQHELVSGQRRSARNHG